MARTRILLVALFVAAASLPVGLASGASSGAAQARLVAFRSCGDFLGYVKAQTAPHVGAYGLGGTVAGGAPVPAVGARAPSSRGTGKQPGVDYSGTNVQEQGVDEPDLVKTDGSTLFAAVGGRVEAVDVTQPKPKLLDTLQVPGGWSQDLLLVGDRLLVLTRGGYWFEPLPAMTAAIMPIRPSSSTITEVDVSNPRALRVVSTLTLDGSYVDARLVGTSARVVVSSQIPTALQFVRPADSTPQAQSAALDQNRAVVARSRVAAWLPSFSIRRAGGHVTPARPLVQCRNVERPRQFSGLGMLTVLTIDVAEGLAPVDSVGVMTDARIVYASTDNLYLATERWAARPLPANPTVAPTDPTTEVHRFDISDPDRTRYRGSGQVSGYLLDQWSLSEYGGALRVVTTDTPAWWDERGPDKASSSVTTLDLGPSGLTPIARLAGLGQGERVYAVRFAGPTGYVVTFKQIDPLFTLDLADPAKPRVLGELELPGYSAYLHPLAGNLLLGVGQDVADNRPTGTQLSLFDVGDLRHPQRLSHASLGAGWSEAEADHHAFLFWQPSNLLVVPFATQAVGYRVTRSPAIARLRT